MRFKNNRNSSIEGIVKPQKRGVESGTDRIDKTF